MTWTCIQSQYKLQSRKVYTQQSTLNVFQYKDNKNMVGDG